MIMRMFGVTDYKKKFELKDIFKITGFIISALGIAISEEFIFRFLIMDKLFIDILTFNIFNAILFSSVYLFVPLHFWLGIHKNSLHRIELFIGLFWFSLVCSMLYIQNGLLSAIMWHSGAVLGVMLTSIYFKKEKKSDWELYDEGHSLLRCYPIWIILSLIYIIL